MRCENGGGVKVVVEGGKVQERAEGLLGCTTWRGRAVSMCI